MHLGEMTVNFPRGPQAPVLIGEGGAVTRRSLGMGAYCPSPRVWVEGYGCLDPSNAAERGVDLQVAPAPMGPDTGVNLMDPGQPLSTEARAIIESAGHTIDCQPVGGTVYCSVDGGGYDHQAMVLNRNPAVLLVELGHGPTAYSYQQGVRSQLHNLTPALDTGSGWGDQGVIVADVQDGPNPTASEAVGASEGVLGALDALSVSGIPGWAILATAAGAAYFMTKGKG